MEKYMMNGDKKCSKCGRKIEGDSDSDTCAPFVCFHTEINFDTDRKEE
jgi:hypothetical protein